MKRCPQCEFIYEDDQSLCDMDGILLVFDSQQLPKPVIPESGRSRWRSRVVTAVATIVLSTVLGLVYYVSTRPQGSRALTYPAQVNAGQPSVGAGAPAEVSDSAKTTGETKTEGNANEKVADSGESAPKSETKAAANQPKSNVGTTAAKSEATKKRAKSASIQKGQSSTQTQSSDSKLGSILKKTGSLLKKPFKL